jgi:hypothetical protein
VRVRHYPRSFGTGLGNLVNAVYPMPPHKQPGCRGDGDGEQDGDERHRGPRAVEEIARENAVEGCVRETVAALVACRQAREASDPHIRRAMRGIARDEVRHASLSWSVHDWIQGSQSFSARRRTQAALTEAGEVLMREIVTSLPGDLREQAGLPGPDESVDIVATLLSSLP